MSRERFPLDADQLELLLAFEASTGLQHLAKVLCKDISVVSRRLTRLGELGTVIEKRGTKWELTSQGRAVNAATRSYLKELSALVTERAHEDDPLHASVLLVINAQDAYRNEIESGSVAHTAQTNMARLLWEWRRKSRPVIFVKHASENAKSDFHRDAPGFQILKEFAPQDKEPIVEKRTPSSFLETTLQARLDEIGAKKIVLMGFTVAECIDSTAKHGFDLNYNVTVVADGVAAFDIKSLDGRLIEAATVLDVTLASLRRNYANLVFTDELLQK